MAIPQRSNVVAIDPDVVYQPTTQRSTFRSIRAMRRILEAVTVEAYTGRRPMRDVVAMSASIKTMAELFVAEKTLNAEGLDQDEGGHPLGDNGGLPDLVPRGYVTKSRSFKKGTSAKGTPVDEHVVKVEGGSDETDGIDLAGELEDWERDGG